MTFYYRRTLLSLGGSLCLELTHRFKEDDGHVELYVNMSNLYGLNQLHESFCDIYTIPGNLFIEHVVCV